MKIILDAGHVTGYNRSPVYPQYSEGTAMWRLYQLLRAELLGMGYSVGGTRGNPAKDMEVWQRGQAAGSADLFLSLHSNACGDSSVRRVVAIPPFCDRNGVHRLAKELAAGVSDIMNIGEAPQIYTRTYRDSAGVERDYYGVIRGAVSAGCMRPLILEHSFHTNRESALWLSKDGNLALLAKREAAVIRDFLGLPGTGPDGARGYAVGDYYTVRAGDRYSDGRAVAAFAIGRQYRVARVLPERILLEGINSWVLV